MKILTIVDLQNEFDCFTHRAQVIKNVVKLVKTGAYDYIVNLRYGGGPYGEDGPSQNIPEIRKLLKGRKNVLRAVKNEDGGGQEVLCALNRNVTATTPILKKMKIDVVGVNTPYCVASTVDDLIYLGVKAKNISIYTKAVSERSLRRHKKDRKYMLAELKKKGVKLI